LTYWHYISQIIVSVTGILQSADEMESACHYLWLDITVVLCCVVYNNW